MAEIVRPQKWICEGNQRGNPPPFLFYQQQRNIDSLGLGIHGSDEREHDRPDHVRKSGAGILNSMEGGQCYSMEPGRLLQKR